MISCKKDLPHIIFLDIDGTLVYNGIYMTEENINVIKKVREQGHFVFLNTGRSTSLVPEETVKKSGVDGVISSLGAYITYKGDCIYENPIPEDILEATVDAVIRHRACSSIDALLTSYWFFGGQNSIFTKDEFYSRRKNEKVYKIFFNGCINGELRRTIRRNFSFCQSCPAFGEGAVKGCTKASGVRKVAEYLGIPYDRTISIGDSPNDIDMLKSTSVSVAMGNAVRKVKNICDFTTDTAENSGVAKALEKLLLT